MPVSPVRMQIACLRSDTKIFPSHGRSVRTTWAIESTGSVTIESFRRCRAFPDGHTAFAVRPSSGPALCCARASPGISAASVPSVQVPKCVFYRGVPRGDALFWSRSLGRCAIPGQGRAQGVVGVGTHQKSETDETWNSVESKIWRVG